MTTRTAARPLLQRARDVPWLALSIVASAILVSVLAWTLCTALLTAQASVDRLSTQRAVDAGRYADLRIRVGRACEDGSATGILCASLR